MVGRRRRWRDRCISIGAVVVVFSVFDLAGVRKPSKKCRKGMRDSSVAA
jgi:hypothetical protein